MNRLIRRAAVVAVSMALIFGFTSCGKDKAAKDTIKIGILYSTTGNFSISETPMQNAAKMILANHRAKECDDMCMSIKEILTLIPEDY